MGIELREGSSDILAGGDNSSGDVFLFRQDSSRRRTDATVHLDGRDGTAVLGGAGQHGLLEVHNRAGNRTACLQGEWGNAVLGGGGEDGDLIINNEAGEQTIRLNGQHGNAVLGGAGLDGDLILNNEAGEETIRLNAQHGNAVLGGAGHDGDVIVKNEAGEETMRMTGDLGDLKLRGTLNFFGRVPVDEARGGYSEDNGAVRHFQGTEIAGLIQFTFESDPLPHDRDKLNIVRIFNPNLRADSFVFLAPDTPTPCLYTLGEFRTPHFTGVEGRYIELNFMPKVPSGRSVRVRYRITK